VEGLDAFLTAACRGLAECAETEQRSLPSAKLADGGGPSGDEEFPAIIDRFEWTTVAARDDALTGVGAGLEV
jgi:hypothetical protein